MTLKRIKGRHLAATLAPEDRDGVGQDLSQQIMPAALEDIATFFDHDPELAYELTFDGRPETGHLNLARQEFKAAQAALRARYADTAALLRAARADMYPSWRPPTQSIETKEAP